MEKEREINDLATFFLAKVWRKSKVDLKWCAKGIKGGKVRRFASDDDDRGKKEKKMDKRNEYLAIKQKSKRKKDL